MSDSMKVPFLNHPPTVAVIRLQGMIAAGRGLSDASLAPVIERAFRKGRPRAVSLAINSPGGSPVQSALIAARIRRLADEKKIEVHAFVEDLAASGGYWLATAADRIWVDESSVVGSIGVISAGFGFPDLIARYGIERRVHTAGTAKSFMDPFQPEKPEDVARLKTLQEPIHAAFIAHVKARRGARLAPRDLYTGEVWVGRQAIEVGLADGVAHLVPKMQEIFGDKVRLLTHAPRRGFLRRFGGAMAADALAGVEERAAFARFGILP